MSKFPHSRCTTRVHILKMISMGFASLDLLLHIVRFAQTSFHLNFSILAVLVLVLIFFLLLWRLWRLTIFPILHPKEAKELLYWYPCTLYFRFEDLRKPVW